MNFIFRALQRKVFVLINQQLFKKKIISNYHLKIANKFNRACIFEFWEGI